MSAALCVALGWMLAACGGAAPASSTKVAKADPAALVEHGHYMVEHASMCEDCHTPRLATGALDETHRMQGTDFEYGERGQLKTVHTPDVAALAHTWTAAQLAHFLETGKNPTGQFATPPMPHYRLAANDAEAVAAYLASLSATAK